MAKLIRRKLRQLRFAACLSHAELARLLNVTMVQVANWERGYGPQAYICYALARALNVSADVLLEALAEPPMPERVADTEAKLEFHRMKQLARRNYMKANETAEERRQARWDRYRELGDRLEQENQNKG